MPSSHFSGPPRLSEWLRHNSAALPHLPSAGQTDAIATAACIEICLFSLDMCAADIGDLFLTLKDQLAQPMSPELASRLAHLQGKVQRHQQDWAVANSVKIAIARASNNGTSIAAPIIFRHKNTGGCHDQLTAKSIIKDFRQRLLRLAMVEAPSPMAH